MMYIVLAESSVDAMEQLAYDLDASINIRIGKNKWALGNGVYRVSVRTPPVQVDDDGDDLYLYAIKKVT